MGGRSGSLGGTCVWGRRLHARSQIAQDRRRDILLLYSRSDGEGRSDGSISEDDGTLLQRLGYTK